MDFKFVEWAGCDARVKGMEPLAVVSLRKGLLHFCEIANDKSPRY